MIKTTVITINYYSQTLIHKMEGLLAGFDDLRLVVVDNSGEFTASRPETNVVNPEANLGFGRGCNLGAEHAKSEVLLFINPDTLASASTIQALIAAAPSENSPAIWGPEIRDRNGRLPTLGMPGRLGLEFRRYYLELSDKTENNVPVLYVSGACLAIGANLFRELGGFCEDIFLYAEDLDLCLRASDSGADVYICKGLSVSHAGGGSTVKLGARFKRIGRSFHGHYVFMRKQRLSRARAAVNALHLASGLRI